MSRRLTFNRRQFNGAAALALLGGATITLSGCGDGGSNPAGPGNDTSGGVVGTVSANHGHVAVVTGAELQAGHALTLQIRGESNHPHRVELTAGEVAGIRGGGRVAKTSSTDDSHAHSVSFN